MVTGIVTAERGSANGMKAFGFIRNNDTYFTLPVKYLNGSLAEQRLGFGMDMNIPFIPEVLPFIIQDTGVEEDIIKDLGKETAQLIRGRALSWYEKRLKKGCEVSAGDIESYLEKLYSSYGY